jgi:hypothetical protein
MPKTLFTVTRDAQDPEIFHITGKVVGTVHARVDITSRYGEETASVQATAHGEHILTVHGINYQGYMSVAVTGHAAPRVNGGYLHRAPRGGDVTSAARSLLWDVAKEVARQFYSTETEHAARVADASYALERATEAHEASARTLAEAQQALAELTSS